MAIDEAPIRVIVPDQLSGARADKIVAELAGVSRSIARSMLEQGTATFDGEAVRAAAKVAAGVELLALPPERHRLAPEDITFGVLWEDDDLAVVDKPPGVVVHPGAGNHTGTLAAGILKRWPHIEGVGQENRWGIVHRLDRDTSGALIVVKTPRAYAALTEALAAREVQRSYIALATGTFEIPTGTIDAPIGRDPRDPTRFSVTAEGRPAVTHYAVSRQVDDESTLLDVGLETGRTHQIRVHLASIGHPLCGDRTYGKGGGRAVPRIFLHASSVLFDHPVTGVEVSVTAPLAEDLAAVLED